MRRWWQIGAEESLLDEPDGSLIRTGVDLEGPPQGPHDGNGFTVQFGLQGEVAKLLLCGELDMATTPLLEEWLMAAEGHGANTILIDLVQVTFMDSSALHALLRAAQRAGEQGHRLTLANCPDAVRRVFELTGTDGLLDGASFAAWAHPTALPKRDPSRDEARLTDRSVYQETGLSTMQVRL